MLDSTSLLIDKQTKMTHMSIRTTDEVVEVKRLERNAKTLEEINSNTKAIRKQLEGPSLNVCLLHGFMDGVKISSIIL